MGSDDGSKGAGTFRAFEGDRRELEEDNGETEIRWLAPVGQKLPRSRDVR
jgi:hypothetical protein